MTADITPSKLAGKVLIPASKSHTIRALLIATLAEGTSYIHNPLDSADTRSCTAVCRAFGATIREPENNAGRSSGQTGGSREIEVDGVAGLPRSPQRPVDVGNSGTTLYLAAGAAALGTGTTTFTGDEQIRSRPFAPLLTSLSELGAPARSLEDNGHAPASIRGPLAGGRTTIECRTSQYLSSLLLAAPLASGDSEITVPLLNERPYAEMTLRWLDDQGIRYTNEDFARFLIPGRQRYHAFDRQIPGDYSSATFFLCAAALTGSRLVLQGLDMTDSQGDKAVVHMLERMGCRVETTEGKLTITGPDRLRGCELDLNATPDALPALAATACFAEGRTSLVNVPQAREKETDRIAVMHAELEKMGGKLRELPDGLVIEGAPLHGARVDGHGDHRVVMALAIAGLGAGGTTTIDTAESAAVTFPGFFELLESVRAPSSPSS